MNVLWLSWKDITHPDSGGAELYGEQLALSLIRQGHTVHWVSTGYKNSVPKQVINNITYFHIGQKWMWYLSLIHFIFFFKYHIQWKNQYDILIDEIHGPPLLTPLYSNKKIIAICHEVAGEIWQKTVPFPLSYFIQYIIEPLFYKAYLKTHFITVSQSTINDLASQGIPLQNIHTIPNSISLPELQLVKKQESPTLIFLSAIRPVKGLDRVFSAYHKLKKKLPNLKLWIVGDDSSPFAQNLKQAILSQPNQDVTFFGKVSNDKKYQLLQSAHLLVHGSYKEGWGRVIIEANSVGLPAVVFKAAGLADSVIHNQTGYIAIGEKEFISYIELLLNDLQKMSQMSNQAIEYSRQFSLSEIENKFINLFNSLTKSHS